MSRMAAPGSLLPGGFSLGRLSHADRVGLVYRARATDASDTRAGCALVLHPSHVEELRDWFEKMAVLGRSLRHPHLVEVYALGYTSNDLPVLVTEWIQGRTLRAELSGGRVFPGPEVLRILREVSAALGYLHARTPPVLHRVLLPEMVMLTAPHGTVKLLGVGHADRPHHPAARPAALSPEELMNEALSPAADVYALASLAYEIFTGRPAFTGGTMQVLAAMRRGLFPSLAALTDEAAAPIDEVLRRGWSFDPRDRPPGVEAFYRELEAAVRRVPAAVLAQRRFASDRPLRLSSAPPMAAVSVGSLALASQPPVAPRAMPEVHRVPARVHPRPSTVPPRPALDLVVPRLAAAEVDASALLPFGNARDETTMRVSREAFERHGPIDVGDAFVSLVSGVIDDPEVIAVIARERLPERKRESARESAREFIAEGDEATTGFALLARRKDATGSHGEAEGSQGASDLAGAQGVVIPRGPAVPEAASLGLGASASFEAWAPKVGSRPASRWYRREVAFTVPTLVAVLLVHALLTAVLVQTLGAVWPLRGPARATALPSR